MPSLIWLVTGCSSGFGERSVHRILARGDKVIATARNTSTIQHLDTLLHQFCDSTSPPASTPSIAPSLRPSPIHRDRNLEDLTYEDWLGQFITNVFGTIKVTKELLLHFRERRSGTTVFVSSLPGWIGHAGCSAYAGSKVALEGIVESLRAETEQLNIETLLIELGRFRTKLLSDGNMKAHSSSINDYADLSDKQVEGLKGEYQRQPGDPGKLVEIVLDLARGEGAAEGRNVPLRLRLGMDCYEDVKGKCESTLSVLEWKDVIRSKNLKADE